MSRSLLFCNCGDLKRIATRLKIKDNDVNNSSAYIKDPPTNVQGKSADSDDIMIITDKENIVPCSPSPEKIFSNQVDQIIIKKTPQQENESLTSSPSIIENSPNVSIKYYGQKTFRLYNTNTNEVQTIPKIDEFTKESISLTPALLPVEIEMQQSKKSRDSASRTSRSSCYSSRSSSTSSSSSSSSSGNSKTNDNRVKLQAEVHLQQKNYYQSPIN
ncbi:unnamed protein product [Parnassius apollo]|uniref:(apollo) hypothetical protein n=1 Tax=Parnassius apollo TaxID=110799 RepID=A0A8S3WS16_PARAO|nr:unnamed protein product [Parnassius apollo]